MNNTIVGIKNILIYFSRKLFSSLFSRINEVTESDINDELEDAYREAFDEEPPVG